jgi:hypothetical protein
MPTESFFSSASLAYLASAGAGKDGKTYSIKPTDGSGDFTFSRGSNLAATRVGPTGLIEKGRENLLLQSNQFDTTPWGNNTAGDVILTSGQTGYDGSSDAWEAKNDGRAYFFQLVTYPSQVKTFSIYAKSGNQDYFSLYVVKDGGDPSVQCDLGLGTITSGDPDNIDATITPVSGATGWYRISLTWLAASTGGDTLRIYAGSSFGDTTIIQDAQLEIGLAATEVITTGATTGKAGLLEDEPRFDYSGGATCPSLLLEPSRTNLVPYSEYFDAYTKSDTSILTNQAQSPEGLVNASLIAETATNSNHYLGLTSGISVVSGTTYTFSVFIKKGDGASAPDYCQLTFNSAGFGAIYANFNLSNGTIGTLSGVTPLISDSTINGFWRCSITATATSTANTGAIVAFTNNNDSLGRLPSYLGNTASDFYAYGFQVEQGSYPTSYIPNHSGGSVTRGVDLATILNQSGVIGQTEGTIFLDAYFDEADKINFSISDYTSSNYISIETTSVNQVIGVVRQGGSTQVTISTSAGFFAEGDRLKCAIAYNANDFAFYINGTQIGTDSSGSVPACDDIRFARYNGALAAAQKVNKTLLFDTRLSNADLTTLTTI